MKYINILVLFIIGAAAIFFLNQTIQSKKTTPKPQTSSQEIFGTPVSDEFTFAIVAQNLDTPWGIAFLPDNSLLVTERPGRLQHINTKGEVSLVENIKNVKEIGEGGLLGITLHPKFSENNFIYLYYTYNSNGNDTLNRVSRFIYKNNTLSNENIIVDKIPGASNHNGGRIKFGPDGNLYITTGDAQNPSQAQKTDTLGGKILRVTDEGKEVAGNPFNNLTYTYGHRNPQGIAWDSKGNLWETEHGKSLPSGYDEINLIEIGKNYGWPTIEGDKTKEGMITPIKNSGSDTTWAPAGATFLNNSFFFGGLRGQALFEAVLENNKIVSFKEYFKSKFGRIRDVVLGPDGLIYISTSNRDGRGIPQKDEDKIIKINPSRL